MQTRETDPVDALDRRHQAAARATLRVLVVDDEPLIRWSISEILTASGHSISAVESASAAMRVLSGSAERFDLVLLDYCLPDSRGLGLLSAIRRLSPDSTVLMMTCDSTSEMVDAARALGAARVVKKPFDMNELPRLVQEVHRCG